MNSVVPSAEATYKLRSPSAAAYRNRRQVLDKIFSYCFYFLKPCIPRPLQLALRRKRVLCKLCKSRNVWPIDESAAIAPPAWRGWPLDKRFAFVLIHDVDTARGQEKCCRLMDIEKKMGVRSSFYFVPERYRIQRDKHDTLIANHFEIGLHGLKHDGKLFRSRKLFEEQMPRVNRYLDEWGIRGFSCPSMLHNFEWMLDLNIDFSTSSFDTDPFEPQPEGMRTIFPFEVSNNEGTRWFVELPYTLAQDFTLFIIMRERNVAIWKKKLDWIAAHGGMALLNSHPDYMNFGETGCSFEEYPVRFYEEFLNYVRTEYKDQYWHALPSEIAAFWKRSVLKKSDGN